MIDSSRAYQEAQARKHIGQRFWDFVKNWKMNPQERACCGRRVKKHSKDPHKRSNYASQIKGSLSD